ncbi:hypothetical protein KR059_008146, partial [Drosophila kikkawai]
LEVRLDSVKNIAGEEETLALFKFRLLGKERLLNGTLTLLVDIDDNYEGAVQVFFFTNGEWVLTHMKRKKPGDFVANYLRKYFLPPNADTNLPYGGENCLKKGEYYFKKIAVPFDNWPLNVSRGLIRTDVSIRSLEGKMVGGYELNCIVTDKKT